jgi:uncharacterized protein (TIGR02996 family)
MRDRSFIRRREGRMMPIAIPSHSGEPKLRELVIQHPDDDEPRIDYADYLDRVGDPNHARFIRVQIKIRGTPPRSRERWELSADAANLLQGHRAEWWPSGRDGRVTQYEFHRGFVEFVETDADYLVEATHALLESSPVRHLSLRVESGQLGL